jgi:hypothetical protein
VLGSHPTWFENVNAGAHDFDRACWSRRVALVEDVVKEAHIRSHLVRNLGAAYNLFPDPLDLAVIQLVQGAQPHPM